MKNIKIFVCFLSSAYIHTYGMDKHIKDFAQYISPQSVLETSIRERKFNIYNIRQRQNLYAVLKQENNSDYAKKIVSMCQEQEIPLDQYPDIAALIKNS